MLKNLIVISIRNFLKDKGYSILNVLGLSIGITFSLLLVLYVIDELSFDKYHKKADRIYRINAFVQEPTKDMKWAATQFPLGPALKRDYPEVEHAVRFVASNGDVFGSGERKFSETKVFYTDSNFFDVFTHPFLEGNPKTALVKPNSIVLTRQLAEKYFGKKSALDQSLQANSGTVYKVTGVTEDVPKNSHIIYNALISSNSLPGGSDYGGGWGNFGFYTYVLLSPGADPQNFEKKLAPMYKKYMAPIFEQYNIKIRYGIQSITDIHLHSEMEQEPEELGSMSYIYILSSVAAFLLIIACINYMNLTTARSARRAKEIGIRKVAGSNRTQLVMQFIVESLVITLISMVISLGLVYLLLPSFNTLAGKFLSYGSVFQPTGLMVLLGVLLFVGLLGGSYPAIYLSKFNPLSVLKGTLSKASANISLRRVLVTIQFSISMVMIICTWVVYSQLRYMRQKSLGFEKDQVVSLRVNGGGPVRDKVTAFKTELRNYPGIISVSSANAVPGSENVSFNLFQVESATGYRDKGVDCYSIDENYLATLGIKLVKGRNFTSADTVKSIMVNENMVKTFGWDEPLGKKVKFPGDTSGSYVEVIGVVQDFHQKSLYNPIAPLIMFYAPVTRGVQVKIAAKDIPKTIHLLEETWKKFFPTLLFTYTFLDEDFDSQYAADQKRGKIFTIFSILTVFITCLGLIGLIAFTTQQRQKEISIRKVMGADIRQIVPLLARNFIFLVACSCLLAFPVAYYFMHKWLEVFPYKAGLQVSTFILSALVVLLITVITISYHTVRVALANPVKSLRTE
jgi:putative ABC transport system permease protein